MMDNQNVRDAILILVPESGNMSPQVIFDALLLTFDRSVIRDAFFSMLNHEIEWTPQRDVRRKLRESDGGSL